MNGYFEQVIALLRQHGFERIPGGKGSHQKWRRGTVQVLVPFNCYSRHTANAVMKAAGIGHRF